MDTQTQDVFTPELLDMLTTILASGQSEMNPAYVSSISVGGSDIKNVSSGMIGSETLYSGVLGGILPVTPDMSDFRGSWNSGGSPLRVKRGVDLRRTIRSVPSNASSSLSSLDAPTSAGLLTPPSDSFSGPQVCFSTASSRNPTTYMLKNVPSSLTRESLFEYMKSRMPACSINFLYMPIDFENHTNFGYAFINLSSDLYVNAFYAAVEEIHKFLQLPKGSNHNSSPSVAYNRNGIHIMPARVQGFNANVSRLIGSAALFNSADDESLPLVFYYDIPVPFRKLMYLNRASILYQSKPSIDDLIQTIINEDSDDVVKN